MATILFDDDFTAKERVILSKTFKANCERLNIAKHDCTVSVRRVHMDNKNRLGAMTQLAPDQFLVILNTKAFNLLEGISVLGHEMVHVAQYLRGDLADDKGNCVWQGEAFSSLTCQMFYKDLPWEKEAFELQPKLHKHALDALPHAELGHVIDVSRFAFEGVEKRHVKRFLP